MTRYFFPLFFALILSIPALSQDEKDLIREDKLEKKEEKQESKEEKREEKKKAKKKKKVDPVARKATIMSAVVPGLGQSYLAIEHKTKNIWKVPIIYAGLIGLGYSYYFNNERFWPYKRGARSLSDTDPGNDDTRYTKFSNNIILDVNQLKQGRDYYRHNRDLSLALFIAVYALNIVDANVTAHLRKFDINENLSMEVKPLFKTNYNRQFVTGLTLNFTFK